MFKLLALVGVFLVVPQKTESSSPPLPQSVLDFMKAVRESSEKFHELQNKEDSSQVSADYADYAEYADHVEDAEETNQKISINDSEQSKPDKGQTYAQTYGKPTANGLPDDWEVIPKNNDNVFASDQMTPLGILFSSLAEKFPGLGSSHPSNRRYPNYHLDYPSMSYGPYKEHNEDELHWTGFSDPTFKKQSWSGHPYPIKEPWDQADRYNEHISANSDMEYSREKDKQYVEMEQEKQLNQAPLFQETDEFSDSQVYGCSHGHYWDDYYWDDYYWDDYYWDDYYWDDYYLDDNYWDDYDYYLED